jgi:hypothetical protein
MPNTKEVSYDYDWRACAKNLCMPAIKDRKQEEDRLRSLE